MNNAIETQDLKRSFGATDAVDNLTLTVPVGSIYAFLGPNGAGKTTTIKMLMNILEPSSGVAKVLGVDDGFGTARVRANRICFRESANA